MHKLIDTDRFVVRGILIRGRTRTISDINVLIPVMDRIKIGESYVHNITTEGNVKD